MQTFSKPLPLGVKDTNTLWASIPTTPLGVPEGGWQKRKSTRAATKEAEEEAKREEEAEAAHAIKMDKARAKKRQHEKDRRDRKKANKPVRLHAQQREVTNDQWHEALAPVVAMKEDPTHTREALALERAKWRSTLNVSKSVFSKNEARYTKTRKTNRQHLQFGGRGGRTPLVTLDICKQCIAAIDEEALKKRKGFTRKDFGTRLQASAKKDRRDKGMGVGSLDLKPAYVNRIYNYCVEYKLIKEIRPNYWDEARHIAGGSFRAFFSIAGAVSGQVQRGVQPWG